MTEVGTVTERLDHTKVEVEVNRRTACDSCHARSACFPSPHRKRTRFVAQDTLGAVPGQQVELQMDDRAFLSACLVVYLIPLVLLVAGAALAHLLLSGPMQDPGSALGGFLGLALGVGVVWRINRKIARSTGGNVWASRFQVRVSRVLPEEAETVR